MANQKTKKSRSRSRIKSVGNPRNYSSLYQGGTLQSDGATAVAELEGRSKKGSESVDWSSEYSYVLRDLRVLVVVSILIFAVMIGAGIFF